MRNFLIWKNPPFKNVIQFSAASSYRIIIIYFYILSACSETRQWLNVSISLLRFRETFKNYISKIKNMKIIEKCYKLFVNEAKSKYYGTLTPSVHNICRIEEISKRFLDWSSCWFNKNSIKLCIVTRTISRIFSPLMENTENYQESPSCQLNKALVTCSLMLV